jgi:hypothetical protein
MKKILLFPLLLLQSCMLLEPDYMELSPYAQQGTSNFSRPVSNFEEESYGVMLTFGYEIGDRYKATQNLAKLDVSQAGLLNVRQFESDSGAGNVVIHNTQKKDQQEVKAEEDTVDTLVANIPKTKEEADAFLLFTFGVLLLFIALGIAHQIGIPLPFRRKNDGTKD